MRRIVGFSLKFRALVVAIAVAMMAFGGVQLSTASVDVFPEFAPPKVEIQTIAIGLTAAEVEQLVTEKGQLALADCLSNQAIGQKTFDALSSHGHNFGTSNTCASRAVGLINAGRIKDGCQALAWAPDGKTPVWAFITTAQGKKVFIPGLHARRLTEAALCEAGL